MQENKIKERIELVEMKENLWRSRQYKERKREKGGNLNTRKGQTEKAREVNRKSEKRKESPRRQR